MVIMQALNRQQVCRHCIWFWPMCSMSKTPALSACTWHLARSALDPSPYSTSSITMVYLVLVALRWRNPSCSRNKLCRSVCVRESASVSVWVKHKHSNACEWVRVCGRACEWVRVCGSGYSLHEWELWECKCYTRNRSTHMKHTQHTHACCSKQINVKKNQTLRTSTLVRETHMIWLYVYVRELVFSNKSTKQKWNIKCKCSKNERRLKQMNINK